MSENSTTVRTQIQEIDIYEKDIVADMGSVGHIDVRYFLDRGDDTLGVADVRVYFTRTDIPLNELTSAALSRGHQILSQIAQHYKPDPSDTSPEQLWKQ